MNDTPPSVAVTSPVAEGMSSGGPAAASLARGGGLVAPALTLVNVVGYVLAVLAARVFSKNSYGEFNALLGALLVVSVPALALQAVVARSIARRPAGETRGPRERALIARCALLGSAVSLLVMALSPVIAAFLHTSVAGPLWVGAQLAPFAVLCAAMGVLQGAERFAALAAVIAVQAAGKVLGLAPLLAHRGPAVVLAALGLGTVLAMGVGLLLVGRGARGSRPVILPSFREVALAAGGLLAVLVLTNLDLLLARNVLPGAESGRYSAGAVLAKMAFWLPQAVAVVVFPRLSDPTAGAAVLRRSVALVAGLGVVELCGALVLAGPALTLTFGPSYHSLAPVAPLWVVQGAALAVVQLLVYRAIAVHDAMTSRVVTAAVVTEAAVILLRRPTTPGPVVAIAAAVALVLALGLYARAHLAHRASPTARPAAGPAVDVGPPGAAPDVPVPDGGGPGGAGAGIVSLDRPATPTIEPGGGGGGG